MNLINRLKSFSPFPDIREPEPEGVPAAIDADGLTYAIGDLHGCAHLVEKMLRNIVEDAGTQYEGGPLRIIFMGDYCDRGPDTARLFTKILTLVDDDTAEFVFLKGNHEEMMLRFVDDPDDGVGWLSHGGLQTLGSFGIKPTLPGAKRDALHKLAKTFRETAAEPIRFVRERTRLSYNVGNLWFVHAAMDPDRAPDDQDSHDLLWGNEKFYANGGPKDVWVVHGHTIVDRAKVINNRVAVDTGAFRSGTLSAARFKAGTCDFITASEF